MRQMTRRWVRRAWVQRVQMRWLALAVALVAGVASVGTLAGCGGPAPLPSAATVLREAQAAKITDLKFTATGTFASSLGPALTGGADGSNLSFQATVTGTITTAPRRMDLRLALGQDQQVALEVITDASTGTAYVRVPFLDEIDPGINLWIRVPLDGLPAYLDPSIFTNFEQVTRPTMVGADTIGTVAVYHLKGAQQLQSSVGSASEDFYVRQDNTFPVRVTIQGAVTVPGLAGDSTSTGGHASVQVTTDFTAVNTGLSIALPSSDQIIAG